MKTIVMRNVCITQITVKQRYAFYDHKYPDYGFLCIALFVLTVWFLQDGKQKQASKNVVLGQNLQ